MVAGTGSFVPPRVLTNRDLEQMVETSDEWIRTRTGIAERHIADEEVPTSQLAEGAAKAALEAAGMTAGELDLIVVATCTPDTQLPNTGAYLQERLGAH
ncbi:MAG TPA: 3-oxoacyl-ACP synthase, partial [Longimicrobiales bacterium]|nr:3-oxoacyl-ACP synthase [Longimicrobiales bacterium]